MEIFMFYTDSNRAFYIQDIFSITRKSGVYINKKRDFAGLAFRLSGGSTFVSEGEVVEVPAGSITYIPAGLDFEIHSKGEEIVILHLKVFEETETKITTVLPPHFDVYANFFRSANEEWSRRKPGYRHRCTALVYNLFEALEKTEFDTDDHGPDMIQKGVLYMNMYFDKRNISVGDIAKKCNISEVYFRKLFKESYGMSPLKYINKLRIEHACRLLESGYYRVSEAATLSGFEDMKYFSTAFKKHVGIMPSEYLAKKME